MNSRSRAALALFATLSVGSAQAASPNIVVLVADDVGFSDLGSFGGEIHTPNLDELAREGTRFANFHAAAMCAPTRAMLNTGVDHHLAGIGNMPEVMPLRHRDAPGYEGFLNRRVLTLAERLAPAGYHRYHVGKWHLGKQPDQLPFSRGYERTFTLADSGADNFTQRSYLPYYAKAHWFANGKPTTLPENFYSSRTFVDRAISFIDADHGDGKPFLTYIGFQAVHIPLQVPREYSDHYRGRYDGGWQALRAARHEGAIRAGVVPENAPIGTMASTRDWAKLSDDERRYQARQMEIYAGMLEAMDAEIGRLVAHLKSIGEYDNTVFVFLSDNGSEPGYPQDSPAMRLWLRATGYSTQLKDLGDPGSYTAIGPSWASAAVSPGMEYKYFSGEGGMRVPLIIRAPGTQPAGTVNRNFAFVTDLVPTLLGLAGVDPKASSASDPSKEPLEGVSLATALDDPSVAPHAESPPLAYELAGERAVFRGPYKLMYSLPPGGDKQWHLYNIVSDPGEVNDLKESRARLFEQMKAEYSAYAQSHKVVPMPEGYNFHRQLTILTLTRMSLRYAPYALGSLLLLFALIVIRRRQRAHIERM